MLYHPDRCNPYALIFTHPPCLLLPPQIPGLDLQHPRSSSTVMLLRDIVARHPTTAPVLQAIFRDAPGVRDASTLDAMTMAGAPGAQPLDPSHTPIVHLTMELQHALNQQSASQSQSGATPGATVKASARKLAAQLTPSVLASISPHTAVRVYASLAATLPVREHLALFDKLLRHIATHASDLSHEDMATLFSGLHAIGSPRTLHRRSFLLLAKRALQLMGDSSSQQALRTITGSLRIVQRVRRQCPELFDAESGGLVDATESDRPSDELSDDEAAALPDRVEPSELVTVCRAVCLNGAQHIPTMTRSELRALAASMSAARFRSKPLLEGVARRFIAETDCFTDNDLPYLLRAFHDAGVSEASGVWSAATRRVEQSAQDMSTAAMLDTLDALTATERTTGPYEALFRELHARSAEMRVEEVDQLHRVLEAYNTLTGRY